MINSKIPVQNKKSVASLIPVRGYKSAAIKNIQSQAKSSVQTSLLPEVKRLQGDAASLKSSNIKKTNRLPAANLQTVEKAKLNENLKTEKKQANKVQLESGKLSNKPSKPVPAHQRKLSTVSVGTKEAKPYNVKKPQAQPEPLKLSNRPTKQVPASVLQRKLSSVNAQNVKTSKSQVQIVSQKGNKIQSQHKSKPLKEAQITSNEKHLKKDIKPNLSKKDKNDSEKKASDLRRLQSSNAHKLSTLPSSRMSNKENVDTVIVKQVKQITEKRKNEVKEKEDSYEIQPSSQKQAKSTESGIAQCVVKENEIERLCSDKQDFVVNESEFENCGFFRNLILTERPLSPGIIKLCSESKVSSLDLQAYSKPPVKKFFANYASQDDFLEDLRRNSSKFQRRKGWSPNVSGMKSPAKKYLETFSSVNDFVEDLRRNSANIIKRRETLQTTPNVKIRQSKVKNLLGEYSSVNDLVEDIRRNSANFIKKRGKLHLSPFQIINSVSKHPRNVLNSQPSALKGSETSKKREKIKKKVTFYISPTNSESTSFSEKSGSDKIKTIVMKVPEQLSQNSTPEFEANVYRDKETTVNSEDSKDKSNSSTPEFNFEALKAIPKDDDVEKILSAIIPKTVIETVKSSIDNNAADSKSIFSCSQPFVNSTNCKSLTKNVQTNLQSNQNSIHSENTLEQNFSKQYVGEGQTAIVRPMKHLSISSDSNLNETGAFSVRTDENIFTPHPISLYSNSYLVNSISPPVLADRSSILNSFAPIRTPLVLKSMALKAELSPVRQRLDFEEVKLDRRESQICLENIPTNQKMHDYLCDQECCMLSLLSSDETLPFFRNLVNPIANILSNGDEMHFVPLTL